MNQPILLSEGSSDLFDQSPRPELCKDFISLSLTRTLEECGRNGMPWIAKRLSGNDTGLTGGHQVGIYIPEWFFQGTVPGICTRDTFNPEHSIAESLLNGDLYKTDLRAIYYNGKHFRKNSRDEYRITRWGGRTSPVQDPEATGSILFLAMARVPDGRSYLVGWVAETFEEESILEAWAGTEILPQIFYGPGHLQLSIPPKGPAIDRIPEAWSEAFPSGPEIFQFVEAELPYKAGAEVDQLLTRRRGLEFDVFREVERRHLLPKIRDGFDAVDDFIDLANSVTNRRKNRTGGSLELNLASIFQSEQIVFERGARTELKKKPDFLFPGAHAYHSDFPESGLHMLGAKTCCKDRWRQVADEAERIRRKHLFTLQEGVSEAQLMQMDAAGISLVVPEKNKGSFPVNVRPRLLSLNSFIETVRFTQQNFPPPGTA